MRRPGVAYGTGQLLLTQLYRSTTVIDGGNFQRFDLRSNKTVWNVTLNASNGVDSMQADWRRGEVFITVSAYLAVLDVETRIAVSASATYFTRPFAPSAS
jgi:hypothetical protein